MMRGLIWNYLSGAYGDPQLKESYRLLVMKVLIGSGPYTCTCIYMYVCHSYLCTCTCVCADVVFVGSRNYLPRVSMPLHGT